MVVGDSTVHLEPAVAGQTSRLILVSGPARSGKSRWAEHLLHHHPVVTYIATAATRPDDPDWQIRLEAHRKRRPDHWSVAESGDELVNVIDNLAPGQSVLIDALGGFVAHHLELTASEWHQLCEQTDRLDQVIPLHFCSGDRRDRVGGCSTNTHWWIVPRSSRKSGPSAGSRRRRRLARSPRSRSGPSCLWP